ncbi:MAG TPA: PP2C family protein-serine/threonine phosphatase [Acidobacteriaceae bacterium]|nr:PP2C family protein-serine/threonine phosphatase [Acidobacteriaceae bacterium]
MKSKILFVLLLMFACRGLDSQNTPVPVPAKQRITLGQSMVALPEWKFQPGDNPAYAQPGYDDSGWKLMSIEPRANYHDPYFSSDLYVPGWTALGFPNLTGYAWYRARFQVTGSNKDLWLEMPPDVDDAYQVYANGRLVGSMGDFTANHVKAFYSKPKAFHLPAPDAEGRVVLALRFYMQPESVQWNFEAGGMHAPPVIGLSQAVALLQQRNEDVILHTALSYLLLGLLALIAGTAAFWIHRMDRSEKAYFWLALAFAMEAVAASGNFLASTTYWLSFAANVLINDLTGSALSPLFWLFFWAYWFRLRAIRLVGRVAWTIVLLEVCTFACLRQPVMGTLISLGWTHDLWLFSTILRIAFALLLLAVAGDGIRRNRTEGWIALPAVILLGINLFGNDLEVIGIPVDYFPFGIHLGVSDISLFVLILVVLGLVVRRFLQSQARQREMAHDLQQAQEVQRMLIPAHLPQVPGLTIESVYLPANEVGGDFFQILPHATDGSVLIVVGDVSGKGLKAAMTVSAIVGALRNETSRQPAEVLEHLNCVLHGQIKGFATCCAATISAKGTMAISNAGHIPPYRNGEEMALACGLPLGILAEGSYEETLYQLAPGDRLTFVSDGVVEATNHNRELFGFERTQAISSQPAQAIAEAARNFGQEDDISVLAVCMSAGVVE